jgi:HEAT repeat protein
MAELRTPRTTLRHLAVILCGAWVAGPALGEEVPPPDPARDLRLVARGDLEPAERCAAAERVLGMEALESRHAEAALRAGVLLVERDEALGARLALLGLDSGWCARDARTDAVARVRTRDAAAPSARLEALAFALGDRRDESAARLAAACPDDPFVASVVAREVGPVADGSEARARLTEGLAALRALDDATEVEAESARRGLDALLAMGPAALPLLRRHADDAAGELPPGRLPRATRVIVVLGLLGDRSVTPTLVACLESPSGWVRVAAATALGDLGDPAAAFGLCRVLVYRGDIFRPRDQWEYPGEGETSISPEDWPTIEYFATDVAACDSLLALGVPAAAGWLLRNKMDPGKAFFRIRVLQDAVDALRRALPSSPWEAFNPDGGIPQRRAAHRDLVRWWRAHRRDPDLLSKRLDRDDAGFREGARVLAEALRGKKVIELQIAHETCALLGSAMTPTLLEALDGAMSALHRGEIARTLGMVEDPAVLPRLKTLLSDPASVVRAIAAEAFAPYLRDDPAGASVVAPLLDDREAGPRAAAMKALSAAAPDPVVADLLRSHPAERHEAAAGAPDGEYRAALTVALLIQEGEAHWSAVRDGLRHGERYLRRLWWDLLSRALDLGEEVFDPTPAPEATTLDEGEILRALAARRGR